MITLDAYWNALSQGLPTFTPEEQRAAVTLYGELSKGNPVTPGQLAEALTISSASAAELLCRDAFRPLLYAGDDGRVLGFGGLAAVPTHHRFEVRGRLLWTWCAWDSLFIPEILGEVAKVESADPESGEMVRLTVTTDGIAEVVPDSAVVSGLMPAEDQFEACGADVMRNFCHYVFFFSSHESGRRWTARHEGTFLVGLQDAMDLAKRLNARNYGHELARRARDATEEGIR